MINDNWSLVIDYCMVEFFKRLFEYREYLPQGSVFLWQDEVLWLTVLGNTLLGLSLILLPVTLFLVVSRRTDLISRKTLYLLTVFLLVCGLSRLVNVLVTWVPLFRLEALLDFGAGLLSVAAAFSLVKFIPEIFRAPNKEQLEQANALLRQQIEERGKAQAALRQVNDDLEGRVQHRTAQLIRSNRELEREIEVRKRAEKDLMRKNGELIRINGDLDNFVYCASHDLKSPVVNAEGLVSALREELPQENPIVEELMDRLDRSIRQMHRTIQDLTEVSTLQKSADESVSFSSVLEEVQVDLAANLEKAGVDLVSDFQAADKVFFTHRNLKSIVYNLVSNAIKYRSLHRKPLIRVYSEDAGSYTMLAVADNGIGIDLPKHEKKIFSLFKRLHDEVEGSGVGLFIVKRIMEYNQGRVEVESKPDAGTVFKIYFPKRKAPITQEA
jgi:signal transduction histidine kinase